MLCVSTNVCCNIVYGLLGASSDVEMASRLARAMVTKYAMSDVVSIKWKCISQICFFISYVYMYMLCSFVVCIIKNFNISQQVGPVAPLEDDKTSPEMANLIEQEVKRFTKVLYNL